VNAANAAVLVGKLLQYTGGHVYAEDGGVAKIHGAKIEALKKLCKEHRPMLIGAGYRHEMATIAREIPGCEVWREGSTLHRWNRGDIAALVVHPKSVGHGLNMQTGGSRLVWYSLPWSREDYLQLIGRLERKGQKRQPVVHRLLVPGTVDDAVAESLRSKQDAESSLLQAIRLVQKHGGGA
jgi:hypothetical protein